jgi:hypothetical protein
MEQLEKVVVLTSNLRLGYKNQQVNSVGRNKPYLFLRNAQKDKCAVCTEWVYFILNLAVHMGMIQYLSR